MKRNGKKLLILGTALLVMFAIWTCLIQCVDVQSAGQKGATFRFKTMAVEQALTSKGLPLETGEPTKRMPKGFEDQAGGPLEAAIKRTRWLVRRELTGVEIAGADLPAIIAGFAADARPLLDFGWKALRP